MTPEPMKPEGETCAHCGETDGHTSKDCIGWGIDFLAYGSASVVLFREPAPDPPSDA